MSGDVEQKVELLTVVVADDLGSLYYPVVVVREEALVIDGAVHTVNQQLNVVMQQFQSETDFAEVSGKAPVGFSRVEIFVPKLCVFLYSFKFIWQSAKVDV